MTKELVVVYGIIYKCTNLINGKIYIGQTKKCLNYRMRWHQDVRSKKLTPLQKAHKKYGVDNFKWEIIDSAQNINELNYKEDFYITFYNCYCKTGLGYNIARGGYKNPLQGKTEEELKTLRKHLSDVHVGLHQTEQTIEKIRKFNKNKTLITNGVIIKKMDKNESLPIDFYFLENPFRNTIPIHNGILTKRINKEEKIPDGFRVGSHKNDNAKGKKLSEERKNINSKAQKGRIRYTNGINNKYIKHGELIPEGYYIGYTDNRDLTKEECLEKFATNRNTISINNGTKNKRINKNSVIPEGWEKGQCMTTYKFICLETNKKYFTINDICKDLNISKKQFGSFGKINTTKFILDFTFCRL